MKRKVLLAAVLMLLLSTGGLQIRSASAAPNGAIKVDQAVLMLNGEPGSTQNSFLVVSSEEETDMVVRVRGVGQGLDGSFIPTDIEDSSNPNSAATYVSVSPTEFHLDADGEQVVDVFVDIPDDVPQATQYAMIEIISLNGIVTSQGLTAERSLGTNLILNIDGVSGSASGSIDTVDLVRAERNRPIVVKGQFTNTGNTHFRVAANARLSDRSGRDLAASRTQLSASSLMPGFSREFELDLIPDGTLPEGDYVIDFFVTGPDQTRLDDQRVNFNLTEALTFDNVPTPEPSRRIEIIAPSSLQPNDSFPAVAWVGVLGVLAGAAVVALFGFLLLARSRAAAASR